MTKAPTTSDGLATLFAMLTLRRPAGSQTERNFIGEFITPLGTNHDSFGNQFLRIGDEPILWSCHTDTVHKKAGRQKIDFLGKKKVWLHPKSKSNCLGADDTSGVWLMREMAQAKVPGLYIFHRSEEIGCLGSKFIAKNTPTLLKGIKYAVALDRHGYDDVITHQSMSRCCSDKFANSLCEQLKLDYKPSSNGVYTDTAQYTGLIGECTNVSVGYESEHTSMEKLNFQFLATLRKRLLSMDLSKLEAVRQPGEVDPADTARRDWIDEYYSKQYRESMKGYGPWTPKAGTAYGGHESEEIKSRGRVDLEELITNNPEAVAQVLESYGIDSTELEREIESISGYVRLNPKHHRAY